MNCNDNPLLNFSMDNKNPHQPLADTFRMVGGLPVLEI
jgi:hypothetical protein